MVSTETFYSSILKNCRDIFVKKMYDYGTAWRILRATSLTDQIFIKAQRIRTIEEKGAQSLDLKVHRKKYDLLRPEGGIGFSYSGCFKNVQTLFDASVSYVHEFRFQGKKTTSSFRPASCQFTVSGPKPENNLISPDVRLRITGPNSGFSLTLGYHGEYGKDFSLSSGQAEFRKAF